MFYKGNGWNTVREAYCMQTATKISKHVDKAYMLMVKGHDICMLNFTINGRP